MRVFSCDNCGQPVYFENVACQNCNTSLGFDPGSMAMHALFPDDDGALSTRRDEREKLIYCANYGFQVCNWLVPADGQDMFCLSCSLNRTIPDLDVAGNAEKWFSFEQAKRRMIYGLLKCGLPIGGDRPGAGQPALAFDIVADATTGHEDGLITLNLAEADPSIREQTRENLNEPYRTLLGHLRHESGHYYWLVLIASGELLPRFRELFGDERADYAEALAGYHRNGPRPDWAQTHISAYATAHPWEDWAESWAHYLHMIDVLETAADCSISLRPRGGSASVLSFSDPGADPYRAESARGLVERWVPLALAMNSLNRSMGLNDFYPFVISPGAAEKLEFVHRAISFRRGAPAA